MGNNAQSTQVWLIKISTCNVKFALFSRFTCSTLKSQLPGLPISAANIIEQDDSCLEKALENGVFDFLSKVIEDGTLDDSTLVQLVHKTLTGLIVMMPLKIKELRKVPEPKYYLSILNTISVFYTKNAEAGLHEEFWSAELNETQSTHRLAK